MNELQIKEQLRHWHPFLHRNENGDRYEKVYAIQYWPGINDEEIIDILTKYRYNPEVSYDDVQREVYIQSMLFDIYQKHIIYYSVDEDDCPYFGILYFGVDEFVKMFSIWTGGTSMKTLVNTDTDVDIRLPYEAPALFIDKEQHLQFRENYRLNNENPEDMSADYITAFLYDGTLDSINGLKTYLRQRTFDSTISHVGALYNDDLSLNFYVEYEDEDENPVQIIRPGDVVYRKIGDFNKLHIINISDFLNKYTPIHYGDMENMKAFCDQYMEAIRYHIHAYITDDALNQAWCEFYLAAYIIMSSSYVSIFDEWIDTEMCIYERTARRCINMYYVYKVKCMDTYKRYFDADTEDDIDQSTFYNVEDMFGIDKVYMPAEFYNFPTEYMKEKYLYCSDKAETDVKVAEQLKEQERDVKHTEVLSVAEFMAKYPNHNVHMSGHHHTAAYRNYPKQQIELCQFTGQNLIEMEYFIKTYVSSADVMVEYDTDKRVIAKTYFGNFLIKPGMCLCAQKSENYNTTKLFVISVEESNKIFKSVDHN